MWGRKSWMLAYASMTLEAALHQIEDAHLAGVRRLHFLQ